jgi:molecular chaperone GrpE
MTIDPELPPSEDPEEPTLPRNDVTVDLSLEGLDEFDDLQALADEAAEELPEVPVEAGPESEELSDLDRNKQVASFLNAELEATLKESLTRIQELEKLEGEYLDRYHRLLADFSNYRNRTAREIQMAVDLSEKRMLREILPVLDSFDRCLSSNYQTLEDFRSGVELIQKQFVDALRRTGVEAVPLEVGDPFDALHAEALTTTTDPVLPDGSVAAIFERGFMLREHLLRPARVVVNRIETEDDTQPG